MAFPRGGNLVEIACNVDTFVYDENNSRIVQVSNQMSNYTSYRAFHRFGQAKFPNGGLILGSSQFSIVPQLPPKILLDSKVV